MYTSRWYVRNYVRIVFQCGDHSKKVMFNPDIFLSYSSLSRMTILWIIQIQIYTFSTMCLTKNIGKTNGSSQVKMIEHRESRTVSLQPPAIKSSWSRMKSLLLIISHHGTWTISRSFMMILPILHISKSDYVSIRISHQKTQSLSSQKQTTHYLLYSWETLSSSLASHWMGNI